MTSLTELILRSNNLKDEGISVVCEAIQTNKQTKLVSLDISGCGFGPEGAKSVAAMAAAMASLIRVDARLNNLGEEGKEVLREASRPGLELVL